MGNGLRTGGSQPHSSLHKLSALEANLIIRYAACMRTVTATEASRHFSDLLDAVERGETVTIMRGNRPVAEISPARRRTGADLRAALAGTTPPDDAFARSISEAMSMVTSEANDPWADA
jgi:prevent-host-death family protein